jgi:hypothetical protein
MTPQNRALHNEVVSLTLRVARPLIWHDRTVGWPKRLEGGTCFFLRFERGIIGVTANHVISAYESAAAANPNTVCQLRNSPAFDLAGAIIARDASRDIATFAVAEAELSHIEAILLDCRGSWPPPEPQHSSRLSLCGFPESMRVPSGDRSAEFRAWGALAVVECVTRDEILITYDPVIVKPAVRKTELPDAACDLRDLRIGVRAGVAGIGDQRLDAAPHHDELAGPGRRRARFPRARGRAGARYRWGSVPVAAAVVATLNIVALSFPRRCRVARQLERRRNVAPRPF